MSVYDMPDYEKENRSLTNKGPCQKPGQGADRLCEADICYMCNHQASISHQINGMMTSKTGISSRHPFVPGEA
jgi:hypothetical protein